MATQALRMVQIDNGTAWADMLYDDATMLCTGVQWSQPYRMGSISIWDPSGNLLYSGTPIAQGSTSLRKDQQFTINLTSDPQVLPFFAFGCAF